MLKPRLVLSACLNLEKTRYDGKLTEVPFAIKLRKFCEIVSVCPEVAIGLPVPREKLILVKRNEKIYAVKILTGEDFTEKLILFSKNFIQKISEIEGFFLKSKSPSCGVSLETKIYKDIEGKEIIEYGQGIFAKEILNTFPHLPIVDEQMLKDKDILENFLIRIFTLAKFKVFKKKAKQIDDLISFHKKIEWLLMSYDKIKTKQLEMVLFNNNNFLENLKIYENTFKEILTNPFKREIIGNMILCILEKSFSQEKIHSLIKKYQDKEICLMEVISYLKSLIKKQSFKKEFIEYDFEVYPEELKELFYLN